jgi:16S rRNA (uracil1498-N3)-methyltransferase
VAFHRFFVETPVSAGRAVVTGSDLHHLRDVLRLQPGEEVAVADGSGAQAVARIVAVGPDEASLEVVRALPSAALPDVTLVQGLSRGPKMDLVVEKTTELGVARIVPVVMRRSVVRIDGAEGGRKAGRWRRVAEAAAKQSQRPSVPTVDEPLPFEALRGVLEAFDVVLVPWEVTAPSGPGIGGALRAAGASAGSSVAVVVGPEGGMDPAEVETLALLGAVPVSLGATILRTETAAVVAVALTAYELGGLGGAQR